MTYLRAVVAIAGCVLLIGGAVAQGVFRYKDSNGNWVYTDRKPVGDAETVKIKAEPKEPHIHVERILQDSHVVLRAVNECVCFVEFGLQLRDARHVQVSESGEIRKVVAPKSEAALVEITPTGAGEPSYRYKWTYVLGAPDSQHRPDQPYRVPYAIGQVFQVTQAYPATFTHGARESRHAIDIALPDQTAVVAARAGQVINVAHEHFRGGAKRDMADEANFVEILHDDGTIALYGHLHWDSIRVSPGQRVSRGEYIANSGNTGFTTGPHLHFVVFRNVGLQAESVPIQFAGPNDIPVTAQTGMMLKAQ